MGKRYYYRFFSLLIFAAIIFVVQACVPPANNPPTAVSSPTPPNGAIDISLTLTLKWDASTDPDGDPVKYDIYLWSNPESMVIKALDFAANSYTISQPLDYGTKYYWKVVAKDGKGGETEGPVWNFTTKTNRPPESPSIPYPANDANNISTTPALSWGNCTDPDGDTVKYDVLFGEYDQSLTEIATDLSINNFKIKEPLKYDTKYWWKVIAKDENGGQSQGAIWTFTTSSEPNTPPIISNDPAPANRIADVSNTPVLSWNSTDPDGDILTYDIYFGTDPTPTLVLSNHTDTKYNPGVLKYNTTYYWKIVAKDGKGGLTEGSVWSFRTILRQNTLPAVPSDPTPADGKTGLDVTIILSWKCSDPDGDELIYDIYFGTDPTPRLVKSDQTSPTYAPGTLSYSTRYYWKIVAKDGKGGETSSPVWSFVTKAKPNTPPQAPNSPTPANGLTNVDISPTLSWQCSDPDSDTLMYDIYFGTSSTPPLVKDDFSDTTYNPDVLEYSTRYYWKIVVKDGKGGEVSSPVWSFTTMAKPNTAPSKPSVLSPVNGENGVSVTQKLSWTSNDPDGDSLTYDVYFGTSATPTLASSDQTDATYVPAKMYYNTTYYWKVVAMDGKGGVTEGDVWRFTTEPEPNTPPTMPSNPNPADNKNETSITPTLSWQCSDPDGESLKYDIYFGTSSSLSTPVKKDQTSATYTPNVLEYSTRYYWKIVAKDSKGKETSSPVWSFVTMAKPNTAPVVPNTPTPANGSNNVDITSTLSWVCSDPDSDTLMYDVYFGTSSTPPLVKEGFSDTTYNPGRLSYSTTYYWKIVAKDGRGGEMHSTVWSFTTGSEPNTAPSKPRNPVPANGSTDIGITLPTLSWVCNDPDGDSLKYDIYFGTNPNPTLKVSNQAGATYNPGTLSYNTMYYWKIVAIDGKGGITEGDVWSFKTGTKPNAAPVVPNTPTPGNGLTNVDISPTLSWQCSDTDGDALKYDIYFETNPDPTLVKSDQTSSAYNPGVLDYDTRYYWKIVAKDGKGGETSSPVWSFVTMAKPNAAPVVPNALTPANESNNVDITSTLSWVCSDPDSDTLMYDIYFGTSSTPPLVKDGFSDTTYNPGRLSYSTTYYWKIVAKDGRGGETHSTVWSFTTGSEPNTAPSKPSVLSPVNGENGVSVTQKLSWTSSDPDGDSLKYDIYFGTSATPTLASSDQTDATYVPAKMYYNTTYYWKVVAMDGKGGVSEGDVWRFTTEPEPNTPPTMPSNPNPADNKNETSITPTLSWQCSDPDGDALKYDVYFGTSSSLSTPVKKDQASATYTPDVLEYSTRYYWKIIAKDGKGEETSSPVWSFVTMAKPNTAPVAPNALTPANESNNVDITSTLSWVCSDPDSDTLMYDIYFGTSSTPPLVKEDFSDTTYNPGRLLYSTTYYWKIVAKDGRGGETHSMVWSFTTGPEPNTVPSKPRNPAPTNGSTNIDITSPTLFWVCNDPDGDPLTYDIYFGTNPNPTLKVSNQAGTTYNPGTLSYNTMYYWKIVAIDGKGGITEGDVWNFKTGIEPNAAPVAPNSPTPRNGLTNVDISPTLSWQCSDPDSDTLMYDVYFDTKPDPTLVKSDQTSSAYNPGVLNYNTTYYWKIVAKDGKGGVTSSSPVWHFVTKAKPNTPPQVPNNPVPVNKAIDVSATSTLSWECSDPDSDTLMYDVYFGTSSTPPLVKNDSTVTTYDPGILNNSTRYYWKIVAKDDKGGVTSSPVWSFTTIWKPGAINWQFVTYAVIYSSPALGTDGTIYIGSWDKKLYAIYPDGTKKWEFATGGSISSSPAIGLDGTIYVGCEDGYLYAINPNGTEKWKFTTGGSISSSPAIGANGIIYVGSEGGNLYAIYPNGKQKWEFATGGSISSSPAIGTNGVIYVGSENGKLYAINPNRTEKWEFAAGGSISSSPAIDSDDTIYVATFDGILYALNQGGAKKWQSAIGSYVESSPVIGSDGTIYIGSYDHRIYAIDSSNGATKWTFDTNGQITSTPAIGSDGVVYVGSNDGNLYAIDPNAGGDKKKWEVFIGGCAYSSPSIASDGTVYIGSLDGNLYAIKSDSTGLANSPWPKFRKNLRSTGNVSEQ